MIDTTHFKILLEIEKEKIEKELATVGRKNPDHTGDWEAVEPEDGRDRADETEVADGIESYENNSAILSELEIRHAEIDTALEKIETGTYGICETGGEEIEEDRLEANPAAKTCKLHMD